MHRRSKTICRPAPRPGRRGFTLVEAAIVTVIIGVGVVAVLQLLAAGTMANASSTELTTAMGLAGNIRERALRVAYLDLRSTLDDKAYSPPVDAMGNAISGFDGWKQLVNVQYVDPNALTVVVPDDQVEPTTRISVTIQHNSNEVFATSWLVTAPKWPLP